jgi:hypothetical protein
MAMDDFRLPPSPPSLAIFISLEPHIVLSRHLPSCFKSFGIVCRMLMLPVYTLPVSFELHRFSYFQRKLTIPQALFDCMSTSKRVHTRRTVFYRRLPLPTYPPGMNGTAAKAMVRDPTGHPNAL